MAWWMIPAAIQAGSSLVKYATRKKSGSFDKTSYGKELARTAREGKYSPAAMSTILGQTGARAGQVVQEQKADIRGYLTARGMGNSIAGVKSLSAPDTARMRVVSDTAGRLTADNELSKTQARQDYARARYGYDEGRREEENAARGDLIGGLAGAAGSAVSGWRGNQIETEKLSYLGEVQKLMDDGKDDEALNLLLMLKAKYGEGQ